MEFLSRHCSGKRPHLTLRGESRGFSRFAVGTLGFISSCNGDLRDRLVLPQRSCQHLFVKMLKQTQAHPQESCLSLKRPRFPHPPTTLPPPAQHLPTILPPPSHHPPTILSPILPSLLLSTHTLIIPVIYFASLPSCLCFHIVFIEDLLWDAVDPGDAIMNRAQ